MIYGRYSPLVFGFVIFYVVLMGAMLGANVGYTATDVSETGVTYNGSHIVMHDDSAELQLDREDVEENPEDYQTPIETRFSDFLEKHFDIGGDTTASDDSKLTEAAWTFTELLFGMMIWLVVNSANVAATVSYYLSFVIPRQLLQAVFTLAWLAPLAILGHRLLRIFNREFA